MPETSTVPLEGFATPEEALASLARTRERIAAATDGTPGVVARAFQPEPLDVAGLNMPPISMRTWLRLEKIKSPFLRSGASEITMEDMLRTFYVIAGPADEVGRSVIAGEPAFSIAVDAFAAKIPLAAMQEMATKLSAHLAAEFEPQGSFIHPGEAGDGGPKPQASSATEQAAG